MLDLLKRRLLQLQENQIVSPKIFQSGKELYLGDACVLLTQTATHFDFIVQKKKKEINVTLGILDEQIYPIAKKGTRDWEDYSIAALMLLTDRMSAFEVMPDFPGKQYTREGMIRRVMEERQQKALDAEYRIRYADNIYGEHLLTNERGVVYRITLRDFDQETGYINSLDLR
ncbi:MAG: hypothetical protein AAGD05_15850, partial [Bacteroidota bacterium]